MGLCRLHDTLAKPTTNKRFIYSLKDATDQRSKQRTSLLDQLCCYAADFVVADIKECSKEQKERKLACQAAVCSSLRYSLDLDDGLWVNKDVENTLFARRWAAFFVQRNSSRVEICPQSILTRADPIASYTASHPHTQISCHQTHSTPQVFIQESTFQTSPLRHSCHPPGYMYWLTMAQMSPPITNHLSAPAPWLSSLSSFMNPFHYKSRPQSTHRDCHHFFIVAALEPAG